MAFGQRRVIGSSFPSTAITIPGQVPAQRQSAWYGGSVMLQLVEVNEASIKQYMLAVTDVNET